MPLLSPASLSRSQGSVPSPSCCHRSLPCPCTVGGCGVTSGSGRGGSCSCQGHSQGFRQGRGSALCLPELGTAAHVGTGWGCTRERHKAGLWMGLGEMSLSGKEVPLCPEGSKATGHLPGVTFSLPTGLPSLWSLLTWGTVFLSLGPVPPTAESPEAPWVELFPASLCVCHCLPLSTLPCSLAQRRPHLLILSVSVGVGWCCMLPQKDTGLITAKFWQW